jgi:serine/threonine protein phosphatase PrpC
MPMTVVAAGATDTGRVRQNNEDAFIVAPVGSDDIVKSAGGESVFDLAKVRALLAVSDGMGGAEAGEVASAIVLQSLRQSLVEQRSDRESALRTAVERANREVLTAAASPGRKGMGATLTALFLHGDEAHVAEVGDSRAYLFRGGQLQQITHDQSYVQMLLDAGVLKPDEANRSPFRNVILTVMGHRPDVRVEIGRLTLRAGDKVLLCSDGLSNEVPAAEMQQVLAASRPPLETCGNLIALANQHGGNDNVTVIVAELREAAAGS